MSRGRAQLLVSLLGVGLWAAWFLPSLITAPPPASDPAVLSLWGVHVVPLAVLLLGPVFGLQATFLLAFPAALVLPFAGSLVLDWNLTGPTSTSHLLLAGGAFLLYVVIVPVTMRRARHRRLVVRAVPLASAGASRASGMIGWLRAAAGALLPLVLAYATHFDRRVQLALTESFGGDAPYAVVFLDLAVLALAVVAADLALFAPLRGLRGKTGPAEIAVEVEENLALRGSPRWTASAAGVTAGLLLVALAGYLAARR